MEETKKAGIDYHLSVILSAGEIPRYRSALQGYGTTQTAYDLMFSLMERRRSFEEFREPLKRNIENQKHRYETEQAKYNSLQLELVRLQRSGSAEQVAEKMTLLSAYKQMFEGIQKSIEQSQIELDDPVHLQKSRSYAAVIALLQVRSKKELPSQANADAFGVTLEELYSPFELPRVKAKQAEEAERERRHADILAAAGRRQREQEAYEQGEKDRLASVGEWDAADLVFETFGDRAPEHITGYFFKGDASSLWLVKKDIEKACREASSEIKRACYLRLHEIVDPVDRDNFRQLVNNLSRPKVELTEAEIDPLELEAVEGWSVEELVNRVFEGRAPEQVKIEFLAELPGCSERRSVELALQEKEKSSSAIIRRAAARLLETLYENGRLLPVRSLAFRQSRLETQARVATGPRMA